MNETLTSPGRAGSARRPDRIFLFQKPPGIAETIDWVSALELLGVDHLDAAAAELTLGSVLKYRDDQEQVSEEGLDRLVGNDV